MKYGRSIGIILAFVVGFLLPMFHPYAFLIRYLIMIMLFLVFLRIKVKRDAIHWSHLVIFGVNMLLGPLSYYVIRSCGGDENLALSGLFAAITPTATAAPVIMGFLDGAVEFVIGGFLVSNIGVGLIYPYVLPFFLEGETAGLTRSIFENLAIIIGLPVLVAIILRLCYAKAEKWPLKLGNFSFFLWLCTLFLIASNTSYFLKQNHIGWGILWYLVVSAVICAINFGLGYLLVPKGLRREGSQTLGQKNTTLTIFLALTYGNALVALGPTCYVLWHNLWNAYQLSRVSRNWLE